MPALNTDDEWRRYIAEHSIICSYDIQLTLGRRIDTSEYRRTAEHNAKLSERAWKEFRDKDFVEQYLEAHPSEKLHSLPEYRTANHSVFVERTVSGWLTPVDEGVRKECERVERIVAAEFEAYPKIEN